MIVKRSIEITKRNIKFSIFFKNAPPIKNLRWEEKFTKKNLIFFIGCFGRFNRSTQKKSKNKKFRFNYYRNNFKKKFKNRTFGCSGWNTRIGFRPLWPKLLPEISAKVAETPPWVSVTLTKIVVILIFFFFFGFVKLFMN